jgi:hypothetical protein
MISRLWSDALRKAFPVLACIAITAGCAASMRDGEAVAGPPDQPSKSLDGEAKILQSWQGDYPVARLDLLPEKQRGQAVGFIGDAETFEDVWKAFKPGEDVPKIDFRANLVLFARNTQFYNSIRIGKVNVKNGVAEVLAMETMSARPIEDKVGMSMVVVSRKGIKSIRTADGLVAISDDEER